MFPATYYSSKTSNLHHAGCAKMGIEVAVVFFNNKPLSCQPLQPPISWPADSPVHEALDCLAAWLRLCLRCNGAVCSSRSNSVPDATGPVLYERGYCDEMIHR